MTTVTLATPFFFLATLFTFYVDLRCFYSRNVCVRVHSYLFGYLAVDQWAGDPFEV